jgi:hypothetical protein
MTLRRRLGLAASLVLTLLALCAGAAHAALDVHPACSPAPADCSGWYRVDVTISWTLDPGLTKVAGCGTLAITTDGTTIAACKATANGATIQREQPVKVDKTPPTLLPPDPARGADSNGWYRLPVDVAFTGTDATSGLAGCTDARYAGLDAAAATLGGTCTDVAGNSTAGSFPLRFDATPPVIERAIAGRNPDHDGWYNHPVVMSFRATDALSGLAQCPPLLISGRPASRARGFTGACADVAGNVATKAFAIPYDATPPASPVLRVSAGDRRARIGITASPDTVAIRIRRVPGLRGRRSSRVYAGRVHGFTDRRVANGRRYRYIVTAIDQAGNTRRTAVRVRVGARLLGPADGALVRAPPLLRWTPVRDARYYNVQLFRNGVKVLSRWPAAPRLQLAQRWRYAGRVRRLVPGHYRWYVWPGLGRPLARRFGTLVGARAFRVPADPTV